MSKQKKSNHSNSQIYSQSESYYSEDDEKEEVFKIKLIAYFEKHDPEKTKDVHRLYVKFKGKE